MKYIIIPYIALGLVLSLAVGIEWSCDGQEMFPEYYGSPFIFRLKSLGSSMTYYYSVSGLIVNVAVWSVVVLALRAVILKLIQRSGNNKSFRNIYRGIVGILIVWTTLNVGIDYVTLGPGFKEGLNYWYMDFDKEAKDWGMDCEGKLGILQK
jgi:hypothetical protein